VRDVKLDASTADCRDETDQTQLLNGSFEEADLIPEFVDCWSIVRGRAERRVGDAHHGSFKVTKSTEKEEDETVDFCIGSTDDVATGAQRARNNSGFVQEIESAHA
jgi:hypothetical protein